MQCSRARSFVSQGRDQAARPSRRSPTPCNSYQSALSHRITTSQVSCRDINAPSPRVCDSSRRVPRSRRVKPYCVEGIYTFRRLAEFWLSSQKPPGLAPPPPSAYRDASCAHSYPLPSSKTTTTTIMATDIQFVMPAIPVFEHSCMSKCFCEQGASWLRISLNPMY